MLGRRYEFDGKPLKSVQKQLNQLQHETRKLIASKIESGEYPLESIPCAICGGREFEPLSKKDRYGLYLPVAICTRCGLIQVNPRMTQESYNSFYRHEYQAIHKGTTTCHEDLFATQYERGKCIFECLKAAKRLPSGTTDSLILEVGCGAGGILRVFQERGYRVKGLDLGEEFLEFGRSKYGLDLSAGTVQDVVIESNPTIIIYSHVVEHLLDPRRELDHVRQIIASDGCLYVEVPGVKRTLQDGTADFLKTLELPHTYYFTLLSLTNLLSGHGFRRVFGDERIHSIWERSASKGEPNAWQSDFKSTMKYLQGLEKTRNVLSYVPRSHRLRSWVGNAAAWWYGCAQ